ncbi:hypothetical protein Tco_0799187 [Tanacetum coccineum]
MGCDGEIDEMLRIKLREAGYNEEIFTSVAWIRAFNIKKPIYVELCHEFYSTYEFDKVCADDELKTKKIIKFRLGGHAHSLTLLEFARRLGLYHDDELDEEGFDVYFQGGMRSNEHFNAQEYWLSISQKNNLSFSRSHASTIWNSVLRVVHKMITYGLCHRTTGYDKIQKNDLWLLSMFDAGHQNEYANVAWLKGADTTTLRELIDSEGRLIPEDPQPGVPRVAIPRPPRASMQDLYDRIGSIEIQEDQSEKEEIDWIDSEEDDEKKDDTDGDKSIDLEMTDDEETDDEVLQGEEQVNDDEDEEMKNVDVEYSRKGDADTFDVAKEDSPSVLRIPVFVIFEPSVLKPVQESPSVTPITSLSPLSISTIPPVPQQTTTPILSPLITTDAPTIIIVVPESDELTVVQLRVAKIEKDLSELKNINHSVEALSTLKSQVLTVVVNYLGSKFGDTPIVDLEQEFEKSPSEIRKIKREQAEKQKMSQYTIKSTDNAALKEFDQKSALYQTMHANKSFNINPANHRLYHALMKALIEDENSMDKGVANTGKKIKRRRTKESEPSKKPSTGKEIPKGKAPSKGSKTGKSASTKEPVEEPIAEVVMDYAGEDVIDNLTQDILLGPTFDLLKGTCTSSIKLEYNFKECYNALTNKLDWNNPEGYRYPFDLSKPLPLQGRPGHLTVAADYFFNNDLEYLKSSNLEKTYTTSITKIKSARYEINGIEDMVPTLSSTIKHAYEKDVEKEIKHWGERRKLWYRSQVNKFSKHNVYSTQKIIDVESVSVKKLHGYGHLEEIVVKRANHQLYKFKEGDFVDLHLKDIEDMMLLVV